MISLIFKNYTMETIHDICKRYNIKNYTINPDGSIDVNGDVDLYNKATNYKEFQKLYKRKKILDDIFNM